MKRLYKKILNLFFKVPVKIEIFKTFIAEWVAILKKKPLYKNIRWTKEQQKEFDEYWKKNYGKKISNRWHRLYEASNGVHRIDYFPEILYSTKIEPIFNDYTYCTVYSDKNLNELFFDNKVNGVRTPKCYLSNNHGHFYDCDRQLISKEKAIKILSNIGEAVIKPTVDSSSGRDVIIVNMQNGKDVRSGISAEEIVKKYKINFTVQEKIKPCKELSTIYPLSINTFRVISYIVDDSIEVAPVSLRIGGGGSEVDNIHAGGMSIAVSNNGMLAKSAYRLGYGDSFEKFNKHPDTGIKFDGYKLSFVEKLVSTAKRLHEMTANIGTISWDFTVNDKDEIIVIEANFHGQSVWFPQMLSGQSFYGENTEKILQSIRK
ncbi:MAG: hypothetical protein IJZ16_12080 [Clostridia bacterium]|nr:hypothetical protein [Clostridia bacterium]